MMDKNELISVSVENKMFPDDWMGLYDDEKSSGTGNHATPVGSSYDAEITYSENEHDMNRILSGTGDHTTTVCSVDNLSAGEILPKGRNKKKEYNLMGLLGWWRRNEKDEEKFWKETIKKQEETQKRIMSKMNFVRKMCVIEKKKKSLDATVPNENISPVEVGIPALNTNFQGIKHATTSNLKRKGFPAEEQDGSPRKVRKTNASFTSTWGVLGGEQGCAEQHVLPINGASNAKTEELAELSTLKVVQENLLLYDELNHN